MVNDSVPEKSEDYRQEMKRSFEELPCLELEKKNDKVFSYVDKIEEMTPTNSTKIELASSASNEKELMTKIAELEK